MQTSHDFVDAPDSPLAQKTMTDPQNVEEAQIVCPLCEAKDTQPLCNKDGHRIWRCPECATDFVSPAPDEAALRAYYDRAAWFEAGELGGYADYDEQTRPLLPFFERILDGFGPTGVGLSVLDIGCGYGSHLEQAHRRGWKCFGLEVSEHARKVIRERYGYEFFIADEVEQLIPHAFDLVVLFDVIEHLANPYSVFYTLFAKGAITPQTTVIITTPNARSFSALSDPANWAYRHPPSHLVYFSGQSLETLLRRLRFRSIEIQGQHEESAQAPSHFPDEHFTINDRLASYCGLFAKASGSDFGGFMQERYVPGTWSKLAEYEHLPRYLFAQTLAGGRKVLDFGCGTGYGTAILARQAESVTGIDIDAEALEWARDHHQAANLSFEQWTDVGASQPADSFGLITCFEMIEHVPEAIQIEAVRNFARLLEEDGLALISTPNPEITKLYGPNPYHIREMDKIEFQGLLRKHFRYVELFEQYIQPSVLISPVQADGRPIQIQSLNWDSDSPSNKEPAIFIAACSQHPIPSFDEYCFQDFRADYIADHLSAEQALNNARIKHFEASEHSASVAVLKAELEIKDQGLQTQAAEIHRLEDVLSLKDEGLSVQSEEIHRLESALSRKDEELAVQSGEIHRLESVLSRKDEGLATQAGEIRRLESVLVEKDQTLATQADEVHRLDDRLVATEQANAELTRALRLSEEKERELIALKQGNWYKLGIAITRKDAGLKKLVTVPYYMGACLLPNRLKPLLFPLMARLRQPGLANRNAIPEKPAAKKQRDLSAKPCVLHVIANFMLGGSSRLVVDLIEGLGDTYDHKVVTSHAPTPPAYVGVDVTEFRYPVDEDAVLDFLREYDPLIVHVHYWGDCDSWWYDIFFRAAKTLQCHVIENINTPVEPYRGDFIDRYVHVSKYVEHTFGDGSDRNMTIYPGSDFSHFSWQPETQLAADCIGMVYRLESDKLNENSIDVFIKVVLKRPQTKAIIVGGGTYLEPYRQAVKAAQVEGNFEFTDYVDYSILPSLYEKMTLFVAPVWKESFGQVSPFAMNMGIPVVGYDVGGLSEIVNDAQLLAAPGNSDELAEIIIRLLDDPQRCQEIGTRNHAKAQAVFSVNAMTSAYRSLYAEVTGAPR